MPTRIRSNGMSFALVINQLVSTTLAGIFLPFVSKHGYSSMFFLFASFTLVYFLVAALFLPETKGKTHQPGSKLLMAMPERPLPAVCVSSSLQMAHHVKSVWESSI